MQTDIFAQTPSFEWAAQLGGTGFDFCRKIAVDGAGNIYTTGFYTGTADFDPGVGTYNLTSTGGKDVYISKLDASGNFVWAKSFGGTEDEQANDLILDTDGNIYTTGFYTGTTDFDPSSGVFNLTSGGGRDAYISKWNAAGDLLWAVGFNGADDGVGYGLATDTAGNVYSTGWFTGSCDFDPDAGLQNFTAPGVWNNIFIVKLNASGNLVWAKNIGDSSDDGGNSIAVDSANNVFVTGFFNATVDFDPGAGSTLLTANAFDVFVMKLYTDGEFIWAKSFGGSQNDGSNKIMADHFGNILITGIFYTTVDFDPGAGVMNVTTNGSGDVYILKLDTAGNFRWVRTFGGTSIDSGINLDIDASGAVYCTGYFSGGVLNSPVDFNPGPGVYNLTSAGGDDGFLLKLDSGGLFSWAKIIGGVSGDRAVSVAVDETGNVYAAGLFYSTADLDPDAGVFNLTSFGGQDIFVMKMGFSPPTSVPEMEEVKGITVYPNPSSGMFYIFKESSRYQHDGILKIFDSRGVIVKSEIIQGNNIIQVDISDCSSGPYTALLNFGENGCGSLKIVKD